MGSEAGAIGRNGSLPNVRLAEVVSEHVRKDDSFLKAANKALTDVLAVKTSENNGKVPVTGKDLVMPTLNQPVQKAKDELNGAGKLTLLLSSLMGLLGDTAVSQLESRLATWRAMMDSQKAMGEKLSIELQGALNDAEQATDAYASALSTLASRKAALDNANKALAQAQAKLDGLPQDDTGYTQALAVRDRAANESKLAKDKYGQAELQAKECHTGATEKAERVDKFLTEVQGFNVKGEMVQKSEQDNLSNVAKLTLLMAMFVELIGKNSEESLKNDLELFKSMQESRQKEMEKKAAEFQEEVRKAEQLNRIMGCIGKILGALLTIVGVVGAIFSGGASLALAAVGVALMVIDQVVAAATGVSFMEKALQPLMDKIIKPLMELVSKAIGNALKAFGVDKATADKVGAIAGAILAAVAMVYLVVLVAIVGKGAAAKLGNVMSKFLDEAIKKIVPNVIREFAKGSSKVLSQGINRLTSAVSDVGSKVGSNNPALLANNINAAVTVGNLVNTVSQTGGNLAQAALMNQASDAMAEFTLSQTAIERLQQWMKQAVESFADRQKAINELIELSAAAHGQNAAAGRFIQQQIRA
ncbi:pathogenicity island 1 effector protein SipB [Serratia proteamaculans]|uniref:type III secretion system translocon subunit SctE n=1 Tax=Serratia proteamaculans TaxID=28151 RepID=UPI001075F0DF|nr:type III secretion system translocon subunit SctE [Serratia proteamaculans]TFZ48677.1 pathogenicity island 1 effector protein SipB [Serratia proteamaculans]